MLQLLTVLDLEITKSKMTGSSVMQLLLQKEFSQ